MAGYYGLLRAADDEKKGESVKRIGENLARVVSYLAADNKSFICGEKPGMTDYMVWPHLERMSLTASDFLKNHPVLQAYCSRMEADPAVQACRHSNELHMQFIEGYRSGNTVYDIGTVTEY